MPGKNAMLPWESTLAHECMCVSVCVNVIWLSVTFRALHIAIKYTRRIERKANVKRCGVSGLSPATPTNCILANLIACKTTRSHSGALLCQFRMCRT